MVRPNKVEYFMNIARFASSRSVCLKRHGGAVLVLDDHIIASGYNGPPAGILHCEDTGCAGESPDLCRGVHAATNAIILCGTSCKGATLYITHRPCYICCKHLINAGVEKIIYDDETKPDKRTLELLKEAGKKIKKY